MNVIISWIQGFKDAKVLKGSGHVKAVSIHQLGRMRSEEKYQILGKKFVAISARGFGLLDELRCPAKVPLIWPYPEGEG